MTAGGGARASSASTAPSLGDELDRIGYAGPRPCPGPPPHAYVELHIEQGPVLEAEGITIGAVTGVQGDLVDRDRDRGPVEPRRHHADGPAPRRRLRRRPHRHASCATSSPKIGPPQVGDGRAASTSTPTWSTWWPARATLTVDLRNTDDRVLAEAERRAGRVRSTSWPTPKGVTIQPTPLARVRAGGLRPGVVDLVEQVGPGTGHSVRRLPSGAGHDAQMLARVCPSGMVFVPSVARHQPQPGRAHRRRRPRGRRQRAPRVRVRLAACDEPTGGSTDEPSCTSPPPRWARSTGRARAGVVERLLALLRRRPPTGAELVVFPELALTTFFPRWWIDDGDRARRLLRDGDARPRHQAAVRRGGPPRGRLLARLRRAGVRLAGTTTATTRRFWSETAEGSMPPAPGVVRRRPDLLHEPGLRQLLAADVHG